MKTKQRMKRRRRKGLLPFVYTSAMALCSLPQNQTELLCTPSMDFVKQTEQARLGLSQCLTPWPSTTHNPLERPVNHPPQVIRILNPPLTDLHPSLFPYRHLFTPFVWFKITLETFLLCGRWNRVGNSNIQDLHYEMDSNTLWWWEWAGCPEIAHRSVFNARMWFIDA